MYQSQKAEDYLKQKDDTQQAVIYTYFIEHRAFR